MGVIHLCFLVQPTQIDGKQKQLTGNLSPENFPRQSSLILPHPIRDIGPANFFLIFSRLGNQKYKKE